MLLQTNSYIVPKDKRTEHARLVARFRQVLARIGCDHFEAYEQVGANWGAESTGRFVQIMRFRDRKHQQAVQAAERTDPAAQQLIKEFCELINFPYQQQQGLFAVGFYTSVLAAPTRVPPVPTAPSTGAPGRATGAPTSPTLQPPAAPPSEPRAENGEPTSELGPAPLPSRQFDIEDDTAAPEGEDLSVDDLLTEDDLGSKGDTPSDRRIGA